MRFLIIHDHYSRSEATERGRSPVADRIVRSSAKMDA
jgi:hypothetical protein